MENKQIRYNIYQDSRTLLLYFEPTKEALLTSFPDTFSEKTIRDYVNTLGYIDTEKMDFIYKDIQNLRDLLKYAWKGAVKDTKEDIINAFP